MLNFLFIFLLIILITPYILRWAAPFVMKYFLNRMQKNMQNSNFQGNNSSEEPTNPSKQETKSTPKAKEELGDYVDFEEIKED